MPVVILGKILHLPVGKKKKKKSLHMQWTVKRFGNSEFDLTPEIVSYRI